jgi:hypothetical protein
VLEKPDADGKSYEREVAGDRFVAPEAFFTSRRVLVARR